MVPRFPRSRTFVNGSPGRDRPPVEVALVGLGAIGQAVAAAARRRRGLAIRWAADVDPAKCGRALGDLLEDPALDVRIAAELPAVLPAARAVAIHTTGSFLEDVAPQLRGLIDQGFHVVSSAEELSYPWLKHPQLATELDRAARDKGVAIVGVGVNPGFAMDALPAMLSGVSRSVRHARVVRVVDTSRRRLNLQRKTGAGMTVEAFDEQLATGRMGHIGLAESCALLACALGWRVDEVIDEIWPVIADRPLRSEFLEVAPGRVAGLRQVASGRVDGQGVVELHLTMALGGVEDLDEVHLDGDPPLSMAIVGGLPGDVATAAALLNAVPAIVEVSPGLKTVLDLPLPHVRV